MDFAKLLKKNAPTILSCLAGVGVIFTAVTAVQATPKAIRRVESVSKEKKRPLTKKEIFKTTWSCYIPTACTASGTVACIFAASFLNRKEQASMVSSYVLLDQLNKKYISKVKEKFGQEAHEEIMKEVIAEQAEEVHIYTDNVVGDCNSDFEGLIEEKCLFYDSFSNRYFEATPMQVIQAEYHLNRNFILGGAVSVNDFYDLLGLEPTTMGEELGWTMSDGAYYWIDFNHYKTKFDDNLECYVLECWGICTPTSDFLEDI